MAPSTSEYLTALRKAGRTPPLLPSRTIKKAQPLIPTTRDSRLCLQLAGPKPARKGQPTPALWAIQKLLSAYLPGNKRFFLGRGSRRSMPSAATAETAAPAVHQIVPFLLVAVGVNSIVVSLNGGPISACPFHKKPFNNRLIDFTPLSPAHCGRDCAQTTTHTARWPQVHRPFQ